VQSVSKLILLFNHYSLGTRKPGRRSTESTKNE